jgi:hypothetical protein
MSAESVRATENAPPAPAPESLAESSSAPPSTLAARGGPSAPVFWGVAGVALLAFLASVLLWQKLSTIQEQLARQSADAGSNAVEARALAKQAQELARDVAARQVVTDTRVSEVALQRAQLEELMQSLSRSRDENLVVDIESALRLAQQQAQLTLSAEPLLAALRTADQRLARGAEPRLARVRAAVARDIERIRLAAWPTSPACCCGWTTRAPGRRAAAAQRRRAQLRAWDAEGRDGAAPCRRRCGSSGSPCCGRRGAIAGAGQPHRPARGRAASRRSRASSCART